MFMSFYTTSETENISEMLDDSISKAAFILNKLISKVWLKSIE